MPIDTSIQFNGHNSYRVTETVFCDPFGVEGMAHVTHSFNAYAASTLGAATRARTRFFNAAGAIVGTTDHSFAVAAIFAEVDITVAVPGTAVLCQVSFLTSGTWWVAEPKSEEGQTATPYNTNYQGQLSMITPDGAYLGFLTTNQIVVTGTLAAPTESLNTRLVTINNNAINLSSTVSGQGTAITNIQAGQIIVSGSASYAAGYDPTTKETPTGAQAKVNALGSTLGDLAYEDLVEAAKLGTTVISGGYLKTDLIQAGSITVDKLAAGAVVTDRLSDPDDPDSYIELGRVGDFASVKFFADGAEYLRVEVDTTFHLVEIKGTGLDALLVSNGNQAVNLWSAENKVIISNGNTYSYELSISDAGVQIFKDSILKWTQA